MSCFFLPQVSPSNQLHRKDVGHNNRHSVSQPGLDSQGLACLGENTEEQKAVLRRFLPRALLCFQPCPQCTATGLDFKGCAKGATMKKLVAIVIEMLLCQVSLSTLTIRTATMITTTPIKKLVEIVIEILHCQVFLSTTTTTTTTTKTTARTTRTPMTTKKLVAIVIKILRRQVSLSGLCTITFLFQQR